MKKLARIALVALTAAAMALALSACKGGTDTADPASVTVGDGQKVSSLLTIDGTEYNFSYLLPTITSTNQTAYVAGIQQTLATVDAQVQSAIKDLEAKQMPGITGVDYTAKPVGDIISICMIVTNAYDNVPAVYVWNVKADGTEATADELCVAKGTTKAAVMQKLSDTLKNFVTTDYAAIEQAMGKEMADEVRAADQKTLSDDNLAASPLYVNDEGRLAAYAKVFTIAGAGYKAYFLDLGF